MRMPAFCPGSLSSHIPSTVSNSIMWIKVDFLFCCITVGIQFSLLSASGKWRTIRANKYGKQLAWNRTGTHLPITQPHNILFFSLLSALTARRRLSFQAPTLLITTPTRYLHVPYVFLASCCSFSWDSKAETPETVTRKYESTSEICHIHMQTWK